MLARGEADQASMDEAAFQKFWEHRDKVPDEFVRIYCFVFPRCLTSAITCGARTGRRPLVQLLLRFRLQWSAIDVLVRFRRKRT
jgi:hypothetical protein